MNGKKAKQVIKEHPILMSSAMVVVLLNGSKTQTRRVVSKGNSTHGGLYGYKFSDLDFSTAKPDSFFAPVYLKVDLPIMTTRHRIFPKYEIGDLLWCKELHYRFGIWIEDEGEFTKTGKQKWKFIPTTDEVLFIENQPSIHYTSRTKKYSNEPSWFKRSSLFMPKAAARIWLQITDIKCERLQDISEEDILFEGVKYNVASKENGLVSPIFKIGEVNNALSFMPENWRQLPEKEMINKLLFAHWAELWCSVNGEESWNANPFVWCVSFKRINKEVDSDTIS